ncbi:hypothetical protein DYB32_000045, partial [Aphanomyces invadans]
IRVKFVTKNPAIRVTETPFSVPIKLARAGLSQVVNHLLNTTAPKPFDFLIDNTFLRTTLEKYVVTNHLTDEAVLILEYVEAHLEPEESQSQNHPDWISAVSSFNEYHRRHGLLRWHPPCVCSVGGTARVGQRYDQYFEKSLLCGPQHSIIAWRKLSFIMARHTAAVLAVAVDPHQAHVLYSGSMDRSIKLWDLTTERCTQTMTGSSTLSDISVSTNGTILSAHPDNHIRLWDPRAAKAGTTLVQATFSSHKQWVSAVEWSPSHAHHFVSAGYDGSVKLWDSRSSIPLFTLAAHTGKALDVAWLPNPKPAFVSGGEDCQLKFYATTA